MDDRLRLRRIYETPLASDGKRVLVDALWPRGVSKERASLFLWAKEVAPSPDLRRWFHKDRARWPEFRSEYIAELKLNSSVSVVEDLAREGVVTLIFANADLDHNHAAVLRAFLIERLRPN
nr:DUF488 family protein [uncultured Tateyamaria sp.]